MKQKIALGLAALGTAAAMLPLFAAFEAHVINVTAKIENALKVDPHFLNFGTVFPQEKLERPVDIQLSESFQSEPRVDDVEYFIRQKPKCGITWNNGTEIDLTPDGSNPANHLYTRTGHWVKDGQGLWVIDCGVPPRTLQTSPNLETWGPLPVLCPYLSKHSEVVLNNGVTGYEDGMLPSFHEPWDLSATSTNIKWNDVHGRLSRALGDIKDTWMIDLAVPCFGGYCAQDWADFVRGVNPGADPNAYTQPIANEHKIFGCDLWVEVSGVSSVN